MEGAGAGGYWPDGYVGSMSSSVDPAVGVYSLGADGSAVS